MRAVLTAGFMALACGGLAVAQDDPNARTPSLYVVEQENVRAEFVVGNAAWGDILATLSSLRSEEASDNPNITDELWARRNENPPVFLFEVARRFAATDPERAVEAYFLGRARSVYDASRCVDSTSVDVVDMASQFAGEAITEILTTRLDLVEGVLQSMLDSGEVFTSTASPWWACSFGQSAYYAAVNGATLSGNEWLKVETVWPSIQDTVRNNLRGNILLVRAAREQAAQQ
ncbi:MAG: hypothetical protein QUV02_02550 [Maricaulis sp.]|uniref:hypothetical protein n=1 Tax=Maricaulis sp. TaxID=1486257 RepID=UPI001B17DBBD|nr:hypothetical protein [Maricaulis sp.]MBO6848346.1 hypothetical protein [Maricaulis sp.]MBO6878316.1 hypothetical protein [Maricaulis sp.]MDM7983301.1 hypothetical protein [Maricaulis sp.]